MGKRKQLMTKKQFDRMESKGKYEEVSESAREVIRDTGEEEMLKLTLVSNSPTQVVEAFRIQDREDRIEAFSK